MRIWIIFAVTTWLASIATPVSNASLQAVSGRAEHRASAAEPELVAIDDDPDISPAVATYTIDTSGTMVEVHSPRTEVPRLGPPKS
ncbi:MAG: hypothetical protein HYZ58_01965 [Acidobacteria bacterium]|nr:hypothetical protein [Acidobacteriota bacterium]